MKGRGEASDSCSIHENIEPSLPLSHRLRNLIQRPRFLNVADHGLGLVSILGDRSHGLVERSLRPAAHRHPRSRARQPLCDGRANASAVLAIKLPQANEKLTEEA